MGGSELSGGVATQVVARPVDTYVSPAENNFTRLATSLQQVLPGLGQFAERKTKERVEESTAQGMKQRQMDGEAPVFQQESDPFWRKGYMRMHGWMQAAKTSSEFESLYEERKLDPSFDVNAELDRHMAESLNGLTDKDALEGFMERTSSLRSSYMNEQAKLQTQILRQQDQDNLQTFVNDSVAPLVKEGPEATRSWLNGFMETQRYRGYTRRELAAMSADAFVSRALETLDPSVLDALDVKDESGIAITDNPEIGNTVRAARENIQKNLYGELKKSSEEANKAVAANYARLKAEGTLTPEFINENSKGPLAYFGSSSEVQSAWDTYYKQQESVQSDRNFQRLYEEGTIAFYSNDPEAKKWVTKRREPLYEQALGAFATGDEAVFQDSVQQIVQDIERTKFADDRLTGIMQAATQAMPMQKDGKEAVPPDFNVGYAIYSTLKNSGNSTLLSKMAGEEAMMIFAGYESELKYHKDSPTALKNAKAFLTPEAREMVRTITPNERSSVKEDAASAFTGLIDTGSLFAAENVDQMANAVMVEYTKGRGQGLSHDAAMNYATTRVKSSHILAGGVWVPVSATETESEALSGGLTVAMEEFSKKNPDVKSPMVVSLGDTSGTYRIVDYITGKVETHNAADMKLRFKQEKMIAPEQLIQLQNFKQDVAAGRVTPEMIYNSWGTIQSQFSSGMLNAREYERLSAVKKNYERKRLDASVRETIEQHRKSRALPVPKEPEPVEDLHRPLPSPSSKAGKVYEHVTSAVKGGDPYSALTMMSEGMVLRTYDDPSTGTNIGAGYSITAHGPEKSKKDLLAAGVSPRLVDAVLAGKAEITPKQATELLRLSLRSYEKTAQKAFGDGWEDLPHNVRAVITDMAYVTGKPTQFKTALSLAREGKWDEMSASLSLKYKDRKTGQYKDDKRRISLWKSMIRGPHEFLAHVGIAGRS